MMQLAKMISVIWRNIEKKS